MNPVVSPQRERQGTRVEYIVLGVLGIVSGTLTTLAGLGGGMMLVLAVSWLYSPATALASTAPALLLGNAHRGWLLRRALFAQPAIQGDESAKALGSAFRVAMMFSGVALPMAFVGGLVAVSVPTDALRWLLLVVTLLALVREVGWPRWTPSPKALLPIAALSGFLTSTSGGGALLSAPSLLAIGLKGNAYVAAASTVAMMMHVGRIPAYAAGGWFTETILRQAAVLVLALIIGNALGTRLRRHLRSRTLTVITYVTLVAAVTLAWLGLSGN